MISNKTLTEVFERCNLVDVVEQYVSLKKRGKSFVGLCPFHEEKTPSFTINPEKQLFYCFGCGVGGNVFSFLQKKENLSFIEAVKTIASSLNINISEERTSENEVFYKINACASDFYSGLLFKNEGRQALNYLINRGLKKETIEDFKLGWTGSGWRELKEHLKRLYSEDMLFKVGLLQKGNPSYDWTRNRITFPIFDRFNRIVGFGARALDESLPKYINTKETPIYNKSYILYGINRAIKSIKEKNEVILVEGYIDVIMCHQSGFENVVGVCGTSLTEGHISAIRQAENVIVSFDPDKAGIKAVERGIYLLMNKGLNVFVISLPKDPAEFLKENGKDAFLDLLSSKKEFFDFLINIAKQKEREEGIRYLVPFIEKLDDIIKRSLFIKRLSEELFIDEEVIKLSIKKRNTPAFFTITKKKESQNFTERLLVSLMLEDEEIAVWVVGEIDSSLLKDKQCKEIFEAIKKAIYSEEGYNPLLIFNLLPPSSLSLASSLSMESHNKEDRYPLALSCVKRIREEAIKEEMDTLRIKIKEKEKKKEDVSGFLSSYQELALSSKRL